MDGGTFREPHRSAAAKLAVDWLELQLRGDRKAAQRFVGPHCGLCRDEAWTFEQKHLGR
jgi:hypothetical protein